MAKHTIKLSIPEPCQESWANMSPIEQGRFCAVCSKTVVDLSLYTDKQLIEFFAKATGKICGRLSNVQLNKEISYTEPQQSFLYKVLLGGAFIASLAGGYNGNYNVNNKPLIQQLISFPQKPSDRNNTGGEESLAGKDTTGIIRGKVYWEYSNGTDGVPKVTVLLYEEGNTNVLASDTTDAHGNYMLHVSKNMMGKKCQIVVQGNEIADSREMVADKFPYKIDLGVQVIMVNGGIRYEARFN